MDYHRSLCATWSSQNSTVNPYDPGQKELVASDYCNFKFSTVLLVTALTSTSCYYHNLIVKKPLYDPWQKVTLLLWLLKLQFQYCCNFKFCSYCNPTMMFNIAPHFCTTTLTVLVSKIAHGAKTLWCSTTESFTFHLTKKQNKFMDPWIFVCWLLLQTTENHDVIENDSKSWSWLSDVIPRQPYLHLIGLFIGSKWKVKNVKAVSIKTCLGVCVTHVRFCTKTSRKDMVTFARTPIFRKKCAQKTSNTQMWELWQNT